MQSDSIYFIAFPDIYSMLYHSSDYYYSKDEKLYANDSCRVMKVNSNSLNQLLLNEVDKADYNLVVDIFFQFGKRMNLQNFQSDLIDKRVDLQKEAVGTLNKLMSPDDSLFYVESIGYILLDIQDSLYNIYFFPLEGRVELSRVDSYTEYRHCLN